MVIVSAVTIALRFPRVGTCLLAFVYLVLSVLIVLSNWTNPY